MQYLVHVQELVKMNNYIIKNDDILVIDSNAEYIIEGSGNLTINILKDVNTKIYLKEISANLTINLDDYSNLDLVQINYNENNNSKVINLKEHSNLNFIDLTINKALDDLKINLNGYKAVTNVKYLVINKNIESKFNCLVTHNAKETESSVNNVGIALDLSSIWFDTVGKINKGMAKSNAVQLARGILIGQNARVVSQPVLKIDEYDVKANHGTAIGRMSDDELFYLMSRGLNREEAYKLILFGLINPIIDAIWYKDESKKFSDAVINLI